MGAVLVIVLRCLVQACLVAAIAVFLFHANEAGAAENQLRLVHFMPETSVQQRLFFLPWARRIEEASQGRLRINVLPAMGGLGKPPELLGKVEQGEIDIAWTVAGYTAGRFPKLAVFELPWIVSSRAAVTSMALQEFYETYARDELANVHVLAVFCHSSGIIMSREREITHPADLQGLKIRSPSAQIALMLSSFGAEPQLMPAPAVAQELDNGKLDGALFPYEVVPTFHLERRVKTISEFAGDRGLFTSVFLLIMSQKSYDALPPDLRKVVDANSGMALAAELGRLWDDIETVGRDAFEEGGGRVTFIKGKNYDEWYRRTQPSIDAWIKQQRDKGVDGELLLQSAKALVNKYSNMWKPY